MSFLFGLFAGWGLAHVPAARWQWLEAKLKSLFSKKTP